MSLPYTPQVVAKYSSLGQIGNIATEVYTPTVDGDYYISCYLTQGSSATGGVSGLVKWTDELGLIGEWTLSAGGSVGVGSNSVMAHIPAGNPIILAVTDNIGADNIGADTYDVFVTVTQF